MRRFQKFVDKLSDEDVLALKEVVDERVREGTPTRSLAELREHWRTQDWYWKTEVGKAELAEQEKEPNEDPFPSR